jgi:hypothetical protein
MKYATLTFVVSLMLWSHAEASPNVALDDPVYEQLLRLRALARLSAFDGGLRPLTMARVRRLLLAAGESSEAWELPSKLWFAPAQQLRVGSRFALDHARPYSTALRTRDLTGALAVSCERQHANPCGAGSALLSKLDTSMGYGTWVSASITLRATAGARTWPDDVAVERGYLNGEVGPIAVELGRDVLAFGPAAHTQLAWGEHAAPLDHVRLSTSEPYELMHELHASFAYTIGVLRRPQRYPRTLVTVSRVQVDIGKRAEVGLIQLLQLGGEGTRSPGVWDFIAEHVRRRDFSASETDSSNRRFGGDVSVHLPSLLGARLYYVLLFEDIRRAHLLDAIHYDADHLIGVELAALGANKQHGLTIEWHQTGIRSQEHTPRTTGFTNANFVVGAPLGPGAESLYAGGRLNVGPLSIYPWVELARLSSDSYEIVPYGPINRTAVGEDETRYRFGVRVRVPIRSNLRLDGEAFLEHVDDFGFEPGVSRNNSGVSVSVVWYPRTPLGTLTK